MVKIEKKTNFRTFLTYDIERFRSFYFSDLCCFRNFCWYAF